MKPSPHPHERQALALACLLVIATVLALLVAQMVGGVAL